MGVLSLVRVGFRAQAGDIARLRGARARPGLVLFECRLSPENLVGGLVSLVALREVAGGRLGTERGRLIGGDPVAGAVGVDRLGGAIPRSAARGVDTVRAPAKDRLHARELAF